MMIRSLLLFFYWHSNFLFLWWCIAKDLLCGCFQNAPNENCDVDIEKGIPVPQLPKSESDNAANAANTIGNNKVSPETEAVVKSETSCEPGAAAERSPLPINKVAPAEKDLRKQQVLPPIGQRPRTANRPINTPIRSTR